MTLATITDDKLHDLVYRLAQRRRAGHGVCDELYGKLLDEADRRSNEDEGDIGRNSPDLGAPIMACLSDQCPGRVEVISRAN